MLVFAELYLKNTIPVQKIVEYLNFNIIKQ